MRRETVSKAVLALVLLVAVSGVAEAVTSVYVSNGFQYLGSWFWNSVSSSTVRVRVQNIDSQDRIARVVVKARAMDGSTVQNGVVGQIPRNGTREFIIPFNKKLVDLLFIQILEVRTNAPGPPTTQP